MNWSVAFGFFLVCISVAGICFREKQYGMSAFATFWAGFNFCLFTVKAFG